MRTTIDLDEDILMAVRELADKEGAPMGRVLSRLARTGLLRSREIEERNGLPLFPRQVDGRVVTPELVKQLLDEDDLS